jgi:hypothetical protein
LPWKQQRQRMLHLMRASSPACARGTQISCGSHVVQTRPSRTSRTRRAAAHRAAMLRANAVRLFRSVSLTAQAQAQQQPQTPRRACEHVYLCVHTDDSARRVRPNGRLAFDDANASMYTSNALRGVDRCRETADVTSARQEGVQQRGTGHTAHAWGVEHEPRPCGHPVLATVAHQGS